MEKYKNLSEELKKEIKSLEAKYSTYGTIRFIAFVIALVGLIVGFYDSKIMFLIAGFAATIVFVALIFVHGKVNEKLEFARAKNNVYERYMDRYTEDWKKFKEDGKTYLNDGDLVSKDMDLLGNSSLYQYICVCGTEDGRRKLSESIKNGSYGREEISVRQEAVKELSDKEDFSYDFEALGIKANAGKKKKYTADEFLKYCKGEDKIPGIFNLLRFLFPLITLVLLILGIMGKVSLGFALISFFFVLFFSWVASGVAGAAVMPMITFGYVIEDYINMFELINKEEFDSEKLNSIKELVSNDQGALNAIRKLKGISAAFNIRYNPIVHQVLCGLTMWDFHLGFMMEKWKKEYGKEAPEWFMAIADMEELLSFAVISRTRAVAYPEVTFNSEVKLVAEEITHPLIMPDKVVANDANLKGGATIITGSNMSGKTTFLRTLGVNLVLAYAGAPVCAKMMKADYMKIFTSMRVTDDVSNGISTFYAEILRIKSMVEFKKENAPMLCLIDEIFKGTNSADRIVGATQVIKKLASENTMTLVSTHDFELCDLKDNQGKTAENYHFEEYYEGDQLKFDYKKKDGRCTTTNAMAILHMAGLD